MFHKATLVTVALALLATATPVQQERGIKIPLTKRGSLTKADGTFDGEKGIAARIKLEKCVSRHTSVTTR